MEIGAADWQIHQVSIRDRYQTQSHEKVVLELEELTNMGFHGETDLTAAIKRKANDN